MYGKSQSDKQKLAASIASTGRVKSEETKEKHLKSLLETFSNPDYIHPNVGKKASPEHIEKNRVATLARPKKTCPHCNRILDVANFGRYHGVKCKLNTTKQQ